MALAEIAKLKETNSNRETVAKGETVWSFVLREWRVIRDAPVHFFGLLAIFIGASTLGLWYIYDWRYSSIIENKSSVIERQESELGGVRRELEASKAGKSSKCCQGKREASINIHKLGS